MEPGAAGVRGCTSLADDLAQAVVGRWSRPREARAMLGCVVGDVFHAVPYPAEQISDKVFGDHGVGPVG